MIDHLDVHARHEVAQSISNEGMTKDIEEDHPFVDRSKVTRMKITKECEGEKTSKDTQDISAPSLRPLVQVEALDEDPTML